MIAVPSLGPDTEFFTTDDTDPNRIKHKADPKATTQGIYRRPYKVQRIGQGRIAGRPHIIGLSLILFLHGFGFRA